MAKVEVTVRLFQITEGDLVKLEHVLPELADLLSLRAFSPKVRVQLRTVQEILTNVRWNYGPPLQSEIIPASNDFGDQ